MPDTTFFLAGLAVCAGVTYLVRMVPLVLVRRKIQSRFLCSFLYYIPYAVLSVMTIPAILAGFVMAMILAWLEKSLLTVAASACGAVFLVELIMRLCGAG